MTVESPSGRHDLRLPPDARVEDLLPRMVQVCEARSDGARWELKPQGDSAIPGRKTLGEVGLFPGAVLQLIEPGPLLDTPAHQAPPVTLDRSPTEWTGNGSYLDSLNGAIVSREITRSMVVAVMSPHPGAGTTTVATLLATLLGRLRQDPVTVADANPESGALTHWLAPDAVRPVFTRELTPHEVLGSLVGIGDRTSVLPAPSGDVDWGLLIEHLSHLQTIVVLDCAAGFTRPACRAALAAAGLVVLVSRSVHHEVHPLAGKPVVLVQNQVSRRARPASLAGTTQVVSVADELAAAHRLKTRGFSWSRAPASWQESIRELAAVLVGSAT